MQYFRWLFYCIYASLTIASKGMRSLKLLYLMVREASKPLGGRSPGAMATQEPWNPTNVRTEEKTTGAGCRSKANGR